MSIRHQYIISQQSDFYKFTKEHCIGRIYLINFASPDALKEELYLCKEHVRKSINIELLQRITNIN